MLRPGDILTLCAMALLAIGVVMVNSAGMRVATDPQQAITAGSILFSRASAYAVIATLAMLIAARLPVARWAASDRLRRALPWIFVGMIGLLALAYIPPFASPRNGSNRWIEMPGTTFSFQPSEIAKWGLMLVIAGFVVWRANRMHEFRAGLLLGLAIVVPIAGIVAKEDLGTGVLIAMGGCAVLVAGGARLWQLAMLIPLGAAAFAGLVWANPYRMDRIIAFVNPYAHPQTDGYHMIQSLVAIANGHGAGRGLGFGLQKFGYLPEDQTDFLFAVICEELGIAGATLVIAAFVLMIWIAAGIVKRQNDPLLKLFAVGVTTTFGLQAVINLFVVTGMAPTKGIALPLLSNGGTGWIMTAGCLGLLAAMDRASELRPATAAAPSDMPAAEASAIPA
jgi:cell division protein FtsW